MKYNLLRLYPLMKWQGLCKSLMIKMKRILWSTLVLFLENIVRKHLENFINNCKMVRIIHKNLIYNTFYGILKLNLKKILYNE